MSEELARLHQRLRAELPQLVCVGPSMRTWLDTRYARVELCMDFDADARSLRIHVGLATPPGAGAEFLRFCLALNTVYWDVKMGLDADGRLLVLSDVDVEGGDLGLTVQTVMGRVSAMCELIEDDLIEHLIAQRLATPKQLERWTKSTP